jgi:uncharacterized damage-inducible protein DinB
VHDTIGQLFRYKAWANDDLLATLGRLDSDSRVTGLAIKALSHTYIVDRIFAAHMRGETHSYKSANVDDLPTLEQLSVDTRKSDQEYIQYVSMLDRHHLEERINFVFTDGKPGRMSRQEMLMHVITHGVGHRGQVSALMLLNALPGSKDGLATYLHEAEASARGRATA